MISSLRLRFVRLVSLSLIIAFVAPLAFAADAVEDQFFDSNGVQIHYTVQGLGDPVVLIHGFTSSIDSNWRTNGIIDKLSSDFQVIALDTRGHGKSDKPHDAASYGTEMTEDVVRLLDHLEIDKAHIVGYSMGGFITLKLLTDHPDRFLSAVLGGSGWSEEGLEGLDELAESLETGKGIGPLIEALTPEGQPVPSEEQMAMINQMLMATNDPLALAAVIHGMDDLEITEEQIRSIEVPVLALIGEIDPLRSTVDRLLEVHPDVEVVVLEGKDHMTAISDPALVDGMREFFIRLCDCA